MRQSMTIKSLLVITILMAALCSAFAEDNVYPPIEAGIVATEKRIWVDGNGDRAVIPTGFMVSGKEDEQTISQGLVVIGPDGSEFVWIPTTVTPLAVREFGSYFSGGSISSYYDETDSPVYQEMIASVEQYGGFYIGRYEASQGQNNFPASKRVSDSEPGRIWVQFSPQDTVIACENLYADNDTVQGFFPWGIEQGTRSHRNWQAVHIDAGHSFTSTRVNGLLVQLVHIENCTLSARKNAPSPGEKGKKKKP